MNKNEWRTPPELFKEYDDVYHFEIDLAANVNNRLCANYLPKYNSALHHEWTKWTSCWCNPPYSGKGILEEWVEKAIGSLRLADWGGDRWVIVMLLPSRTGTQWFSEIWERSKVNRNIEIEFLRGRVAFIDEDNKPCKGNPENSIVVTMRSFTYGLQSSL